jgi:hypothetical protein
MASHQVINLTSLPSGKTYEDRYGAWLDLFHSIALTPPEDTIEVLNPPASWVALLLYMNCTVTFPLNHFAEDQIPLSAVQELICLADSGSLRRSDIESMCTFRPETIDGLYKFDNEWGNRARALRAVREEREFVVTTTAAFFRPEVQEWLTFILPNYVPKKSKVVLCPCAADKPYPATLHKALLERLPPDWYLANATGVLGLVPQDLWPLMPHYDSGIPNEQRVEEVVRDYFTRHSHRAVVCYSDFYAGAIHRGLAGMARCEQHYAFGFKPMGYQPLLAEESLDRLSLLIRKADGCRFAMDYEV